MDKDQPETCAQRFFFSFLFCRCHGKGRMHGPMGLEKEKKEKRDKGQTNKTNDCKVNDKTFQNEIYM